MDYKYWKTKVNYVLGLVPDSPKTLDLAQPISVEPPVKTEKDKKESLDKSTQIIHIKQIP